MQETARDPWDWWAHAGSAPADRNEMVVVALLGAAIAALLLSSLYWCLI